MSDPLVSILIPAHNVEKWLAATLESALNQSWANKEIIVVDDGSSDRTLEIAKAHESRDIKVFRQQKKGASAARNLALSRAGGEFIQYLDADDLLDRDKIAIQVKVLREAENHNCVTTCSWARLHDVPKKSEFVPDPVWKTLVSVDLLISSWAGGGIIPIHAWLTPREIIERAGPWDETLSTNDDGEYFSRIVLASQRAIFCPSARCYYRTGRENNLSGRTSLEAYQSIHKSYVLIADRILKIKDNARARAAAARVFQSLAYAVYPYSEELFSRSQQRAQELGGCDLKPAGGPLFLLLTRVLGWKKAKKLQKKAFDIGYKRIAIGRIASGLSKNK